MTTNNYKTTIDITTSFHNYDHSNQDERIVLQNSNNQAVIKVKTDELLTTPNTEVYLQITKGRQFSITLKANAISGDTASFNLPSSALPYGKANYTAILKVIDLTNSDTFLTAPKHFYVEEGAVNFCDISQGDINWQSLGYTEFKDLVNFLNQNGSVGKYNDVPFTVVGDEVILTNPITKGNNEILEFIVSVEETITDMGNLNIKDDISFKVSTDRPIPLSFSVAKLGLRHVVELLMLNNTITKLKYFIDSGDGYLLPNSKIDPNAVKKILVRKIEVI